MKYEDFDDSSAAVITEIIQVEEIVAEEAPTVEGAIGQTGPSDFSMLNSSSHSTENYVSPAPTEQAGQSSPVSIDAAIEIFVTDTTPVAVEHPRLVDPIDPLPDADGNLPFDANIEFEDGSGEGDDGVSNIVTTTDLETGEQNVYKFNGQGFEGEIKSETNSSGDIRLTIEHDPGEEGDLNSSNFVGPRQELPKTEVILGASDLPSVDIKSGDINIQITTRADDTIQVDASHGHNQFTVETNNDGMVTGTKQDGAETITYTVDTTKQDMIGSYPATRTIVNENGDSSTEAGTISHDGRFVSDKNEADSRIVPDINLSVKREQEIWDLKKDPVKLAENDEIRNFMGPPDTESPSSSTFADDGRNENGALVSENLVSAEQSEPPTVIEPSNDVISTPAADIPTATIDNGLASVGLINGVADFFDPVDTHSGMGTDYLAADPWVNNSGGNYLSIGGGWGGFDFGTANHWLSITIPDQWETDLWNAQRDGKEGG